MARKAFEKLALSLSWLIFLHIAACSGTINPAAVPTTVPTTTVQADLDMKPIVRDFLAGLPTDWHLMTIEDVSKTAPFVVDVRQPDEYKQGFIENAVNVPLRELVQNLQVLPAADKDIVVVCDNGHRSAVGMAVLQMLGYRQAKSLAGGMQAWREARLPIVTAPVPTRPTRPAPQVNAQLRAMLDYYLVHTLPVDWGILDPARLTEDQKRKSSSELEVQPETFDQGPSILVDVEEPEEFARADLNPTKSINAPLRALPDTLDNMPLQETITWF